MWQGVQQVSYIKILSRCTTQDKAGTEELVFHSNSLVIWSVQDYLFFHSRLLYHYPTGYERAVEKVTTVFFQYLPPAKQSQRPLYFIVKINQEDYLARAFGKMKRKRIEILFDGAFSTDETKALLSENRVFERLCNVF